MSSYVVWANKGGIGKSTMTFQLACASAAQHPKKIVYVIDLSPQCDVSRMLLGGGHHGGEERIIEIMQNNPRKTVQSYLLDCLNNVPSGIGWPDPIEYTIDPNAIRDNNATKIPSNLRLICGDFDLERTIQLIEQFQQPPKRSGRAPTGPEYSSYLLTRSFIKHAVDAVNSDENSIIFIDTDPYFNVITTHMGLVAAERWISAYSPNSQASQFAVLRSIEFMFDHASGLKAFLTDQVGRYPKPWYDNRGGAMTAPDVSIAMPYLLIANMVSPYRKSGNQGYTDPQRLHAETIRANIANTQKESKKYDVNPFTHYEHMWDMRRLGLLSDYNGIGLNQLILGNNYPEPGLIKSYHLNRTGGTPSQLAGYMQRVKDIIAKL